jgi:hypothetical protein
MRMVEKHLQLLHLAATTTTATDETRIETTGTIITIMTLLMLIKRTLTTSDPGLTSRAKETKLAAVSRSHVVVKEDEVEVQAGGEDVGAGVQATKEIGAISPMAVM